jgi:hypothetical protein
MVNAARRTVSMCPGPVSRRSFLEVGSLGLGMLGLSDILRLKATAAETASRQTSKSATSIIFIWLPGGPPHMEMYDMKPDAPNEYRGLFRPVSTNVKGIDVCELLPLHTKCADRYTIVRSVAHEFADHGGGHKRFLTGRLLAPMALLMMHQLWVPLWRSAANVMRQACRTIFQAQNQAGLAWMSIVSAQHILVRRTRHSMFPETPAKRALQFEIFQSISRHQTDWMIEQNC